MRTLLLLPLLLLAACGSGDTRCTKCGHDFDRSDNAAGFLAAGAAGTIAGGAAGAGVGAWIGAGTGVAVGGGGAIPGWVVGGVAGGIVGGVGGCGCGLWAYDSFVTCPSCHKTFKR